MSAGNVQLEESWQAVLAGEFDTEYWEKLTQFVRSEYKSATVYPPPQFVFNAFDSCPFDRVKVVILGQDPYHGKGQAHGLSFSVREGVRIPPSLQNIYKELHEDVGKEIPLTGDLSHWAQQGVLLLNATLTVRAGVAGSHQNKGWEQFTDAAIKALSDKRKHLVFLLWGNYARAKKELIDTSKHLVLEAPHPSPFSATSGFFGCKHFSKANVFLQEHNQQAISW